MSGRRTDMHQVQELIRLHRLGRSAREIARQLRMGRETVRQQMRSLEAAGVLDGRPEDLPEAARLLEIAGPPAEPPQQRSSVAEWRGRIEKLRERGAGPTAIHDWLRLNCQ
jgi:DNA-binding transcriptional MocR family regulator